MKQTFSPQINNPQKRSNLGFLAVVGVGGLWLVISLGVIWQYAGEIFNYIYYICQARWENLIQQFPGGMNLIIPLMMAAILGRGIFLLWARWQRTRKFTRDLAAFQVQLPSRLDKSARQAGLASTDLVCFNASAAQAFSLGAWRPRVWLSTGLLALLDDDELMAVLRHEANHCRQRDPLRLLFSRLISDVFFFVPLLSNLADYSHLAQEMAADSRAIKEMGDTVPLASALHKLLTGPNAPISAAGIALSQLNITERRILALVSSDQCQRWSPSLPHWIASFLLAFLLLGSTFLAQPNKHQPTLTCTTNQAVTYRLNLPEYPDTVGK